MIYTHKLVVALTWHQGRADYALLVLGIRMARLRFDVPRCWMHSLQRWHVMKRCRSPDFTEHLIWQTLDDAQQAKMISDGFIAVDNP